MKQNYCLVLRIYDGNEIVATHKLTPLKKRSEAILEFPHLYVAKRLGEYAGLIENYVGYIELGEVVNDRFISFEDVEVKEGE